MDPEALNKQVRSITDISTPGSVSAAYYVADTPAGGAPVGGTPTDGGASGSSTVSFEPDAREYRGPGVVAWNRHVAQEAAIQSTGEPLQRRERARATLPHWRELRGRYLRELMGSVGDTPAKK